MVSRRPFNLKKVSRRPEMVSHRPSSKKRFAIDRFWLPVVQKRFSVPKTTFFDLIVIECGITGHCSHTCFLRFRGENLLSNQIFFKLVYLLNHLTVFCNFLHDGRKPLGEETEYALVVIRG